MKRARCLAAACSLAAMAGCAAAAGQGHDARPQAQEERAAGAVQPRDTADPAARPASLPRRRSVQQIVSRVAPAGPSYGPVLTAPVPALPLAPGLAPVYPPPPAQINTCGAALCTDAAGNSYGAGIGNAAVNGQGRLCNRVGTTMQCF